MEVLKAQEGEQNQGFVSWEEGEVGMIVGGPHKWEWGSEMVA